MNEIAVMEGMAAALADRGIAVPAEHIAADRATIQAQLDGKPLDESATPAQPGAAAAPVGVDPLDAIAFAGPASPSEYRFEPPPEGVASSTEQATEFATFFHAEQVPVPIVGEINRRWNAAAAAPPNAGQLEHSRQACMSTLAKLWGADREANLAVAQREVARMEKARPGLAEMLDFSGLGNDPYVITNIVNLARARGRHA